MFKNLLKEPVDRNDYQWRIDSSRKSLEDSKKAVADFEDAHDIKT